MISARGKNWCASSSALPCRYTKYISGQAAARAPTMTLRTSVVLCAARASLCGASRRCLKSTRQKNNGQPQPVADRFFMRLPVFRYRIEKRECDHYLPAMLRIALPARIATTSIAKALRAGRRANVAHANDLFRIRALRYYSAYSCRVFTTRIESPAQAPFPRSS